MSDQTKPNMFEGDPSKNTETPAPDQTKDSAKALLVGEGRKYKDEESLAKAYMELDSFAETLKGENKELRDKVAGAKTLDDVLARLKQPEASANDKGAASGPQGLTADAIVQIVEQTVTGLETKRSAADNLTRADAKMRELYGEKAEAVYASKANTPQLRAALKQLASVDPDAFVKLFDPGQPQAKATQADAGGSTNTEALKNVNQSGRATDPTAKEYYDHIRKTDRKKYYSTEFQLQMSRAAQANPEKFFGRKT